MKGPIVKKRYKAISNRKASMALADDHEMHATEIEIDKELKDKRDVCFMWLERLTHDCALNTEVASAN
jgi:hypothetical protein